MNIPVFAGSFEDNWHLTVKRVTGGKTDIVVVPDSELMYIHMASHWLSLTTHTLICLYLIDHQKWLMTTIKIIFDLQITRGLHSTKQKFIARHIKLTLWNNKISTTFLERYNMMVDTVQQIVGTIYLHTLKEAYSIMKY